MLLALLVLYLSLPIAVVSLSPHSHSLCPFLANNNSFTIYLFTCLNYALKVKARNVVGIHILLIWTK